MKSLFTKTNILIVLLVLLPFAGARAAWRIQALELQPQMEASMSRHVSSTGVKAVEKKLYQARTLSKLCPLVFACSLTQSSNGVLIANDEIGILEAELQIYEIKQKADAAYQKDGDAAAMSYLP